MFSTVAAEAIACSVVLATIRTFEELSLTSNGSSVEISVVDTSETLATLADVNLNQIATDNFEAEA